ncbi:hypothetical protein [Planotetraspora sp. GP83]|uniref:hypothetical protein n=1 Tax=Planotetraspora sp. GP83 TaxID=3156264 RepID=UPI003510F7D4
MRDSITGAAALAARAASAAALAARAADASLLQAAQVSFVSAMDQVLLMAVFLPGRTARPGGAAESEHELTTAR